MALVLGLMAASILLTSTLCGEFDIHKYRHCTELQDRVHRGWKACGHADDLVTRLDRTVA